MLTKKDLDALDDIQEGRKNVQDTHLADAQAPAAADPAAASVAQEDDGKLHLAREFGEALVDVVIPGAGSGEPASTVKPIKSQD